MLAVQSREHRLHQPYEYDDVQQVWAVPRQCQILYTYVSGDGRDETVVMTDLDDSGSNCSIAVNGIPCNSCGVITCTDSSGNEYDGTAVDCENVEAGASYDTCGN
jgi:hypothetical protein